MFSLANSCRSRYGILRTLIDRGFQPRTITPLFNSVVSYATPCMPCSDGTPTKPSRAPKKCSNIKRVNPCGPSKGGRGGGHQYCYKPYQEQGYVDHDYKNMKLKRPMTPHLEIFAMTMPAAMSIFQRVTGVIITCYALLLSGGTLFLTNGIETYVSMIQSLNLSKTSVLIIKLILALPFAFHYCNGIRFCIWNTARFLSTKEVASTGYMALIGCLVGAGVFAVLF